MTSQYEPKEHVPLPPPDARVHTTVCDYCIVGCGYRVFTWPDGEQGGPKANENGLGVDLPVKLGGGWISPNQHNFAMVDGKRHHVVVQPDPDATVVNRGGNHSIRGGNLAGKVYNPDGPTADRLKTPMLRVNGELTPIPWDDAIEIMARVSEHVLSTHGAPAWGMKMYSYQFFENTYALTKLAFRSIVTPAFSPHDKPGPGNDTAGVDDSGLQRFPASYDDWAQADVIFISGTDPFETKTIVFTEWMMTGNHKKLIFTLPRKTTGVAWAEKNGGLFLQVIPGTDTVLHLAIARVILENGWEDREFIDRWVSTSWEIGSGMGRGTRNTPWQWRTTWGKLGTDFEGYKAWLLEQPHAELSKAAEITGVPEDKIVEAARMITGAGGPRPKASFAFEKGNYWSNNYLNTSSYAALGLLCGAGNRPGQVISRLGGHQRGWMGGGSYPRNNSPNKLPGRRRQEIDLDRWVEAGNLRFAWVVGTTWIQAMAASNELWHRFRQLIQENPHQVSSTDVETAAQALIQRADSGGMVVVNSDIYLRKPMGSDLADVVLPAATWGEHDFTRENGERRLRLYSGFSDPPGEAKPDWWAVAQFAQRMGFKGYDWRDSNEVFEESARFGRGGRRNYQPLVKMAKLQGMTAHEFLRTFETHGIQAPIRWYSTLPEYKEEGYLDYAGFFEDPEGRGVIVGTKRLHDAALDLGVPEGVTVHKKWLTHFSSQSGKAVLNKSPWEWFSDFYERITPRGDELWVTNGRINEVWQSAFDDARKPYIMNRWPTNHVEIHPDDARSRSIESGDLVIIESDDILVQTGGFTLVEGDEFLYSRLEENGLIRTGSGRCRALAMVTDAVRPGVLFTNFLWAPGWPNTEANSLIHRVPDPITLRYRFKLGKGRIRKTGESPYKDTFTTATFKPRTIV